MVGIFSRHRSLALLASVVLAQILLLAFQIKRDRDVRLIRYWAVGIMSPAERSGTWGFSTIHGIWSGYIDLHDARAENERMRAELGRLQLRNRELESQANEAQRLSKMLNFRDAHPEASILAAQVIGASADPTSHTLFINRGMRDHVRNNMAVVTPDGVVGKIVEVFPSTAQVLLLNDKESGVGALFASSRTHGVVKGSGDPDPRLDYIVNDDKVQPGDTVLTSGDDRIFPKGLLIGTVIDAKPALPFQIIHVRPAARLDRLEDVLVLLTQQELQPRKTGDAAYSLVPDQPAPAEAAPVVIGSSAASSSKAPAKPGASSAALGSSNNSGTIPPSRARAPPSPLPAQRPHPRPSRPQRRSPLPGTKMSSMLSTGAQTDSNVEVHKYYTGTVVAAAFLALLFQAFLHKYGRWAEMIDLPLLVTIYFGVSKRNPVSGLLLGAVIGILQDALGHDSPIGLYGIAKTIIGYLASSVGAKIDTDHPASRFGLIFILFHVHQAVLAITERALLNQSARFFTSRLLVDSLVTAAFGVLIFSLLDRLRRPS